MLEINLRERDQAQGRSCVMQCGRPACAIRVADRDLCAHCFIKTVEIVAAELRSMHRASLDELPFTGRPDPDLYSAIGRTALPGIAAIARELGNGRAAHGERRGRDDPNPAMCDDDR